MANYVRIVAAAPVQNDEAFTLTDIPWDEAFVRSVLELLETGNPTYGLPAYSAAGGYYGVGFDANRNIFMAYVKKT